MFLARLVVSLLVVAVVQVPGYPGYDSQSGLAYQQGYEDDDQYPDNFQQQILEQRALDFRRGDVSPSDDRVWDRDSIPVQNPIRDRLAISVVPTIHGVAGHIEIGQPEKRLRTLFDTTSYHVWVVPNRQRDHESKEYDPLASKSYGMTGQQVQDSFSNGGQARGRVKADDIKLGIGIHRIELDTQRFGTPESYTGALEDLEVIFGLGLIPEGDALSPLKRITQQRPNFGIYLNKYSEEESRLIFGDDVTDFVEGEFRNPHSVVPLSDGSYQGWVLNLRGFYIGADDGFQVPSGTFIIPDTTSNFIEGPSNVISEINSRIFSRIGAPLGQFACPLQDPARLIQLYEALPTVAIVIDGEIYTLTVEDYINMEGEICRTVFREHDLDYFRAGKPFLTKYFAQFNYAEKTVRFAKAVQDQPEGYILTGLKTLLAERPQR